MCLTQEDRERDRKRERGFAERCAPAPSARTAKNTLGSETCSNTAVTQASMGFTVGT